MDILGEVPRPRNHSLSRPAILTGLTREAEPSNPLSRPLVDALHDLRDAQYAEYMYRALLREALDMIHQQDQSLDTLRRQVARLCEELRTVRACTKAAA